MVSRNAEGPDAHAEAEQLALFVEALATGEKAFALLVEGAKYLEADVQVGLFAKATAGVGPIGAGISINGISYKVTGSLENGLSGERIGPGLAMGVSVGPSTVSLSCNDRVQSATGRPCQFYNTAFSWFYGRSRSENDRYNRRIRFKAGGLVGGGVGFDVDRMF